MIFWCVYSNQSSSQNIKLWGTYKVNWWLPLTWFQTLFLGYEFQIRPYCRKSDFENNFIFWFHRICLRDRKLCCETNMHKQLEQEYAQLDEECSTVSEEIQALEGKLEPWKKLYILIMHVFTTFPIFPRKEIQPFGWNLAQLMYSITVITIDVTFQGLFLNRKDFVSSILSIFIVIILMHIKI